MPKLPGFGGSAYTSFSINADSQSCVNLYAEAVESGAGKASPVLYLTPGLQVFATIGSGPIRGIVAGERRCFVVSGFDLYELFESTLTSYRGGVNSDGRIVQMAFNGHQLAVASNSLLWVDPGTGANIVHFTGVGADPVGARQLAYLDSYFIAMDVPTEGVLASPRSFHHSASLNGLTWDAADMASKEGQPDQLNGMLTSHEDLWLFGSQSTEVWRNNYSAEPTAFPWERDPGAMMHQGIVGEFSHCRLAEGVAWLSGNPQGYCMALHAQGYQPKRVSTHAVEQEWATYTTVADAESFSYTDHGHHFWMISFPTANKTWCYDATTQLWHRRGWWNGSSLNRHRARVHADVLWPSGQSMHLVGDWQNGKIYKMSTDYYDDAGVPIHWERTCPHTADENHRMMFSRMELEMEKATGQTATLSWSNDGGKNFNAGLSASNGASGATKTRLHWHRLGSARDRVFRFSGSSTGKTALIDAYVNLQPGRH